MKPVSHRTTTDLLPVRNVAALLRVSERTVWRQIKRGVLPTVLVSRRRLYVPTDIAGVEGWTLRDRLDKMARDARRPATPNAIRREWLEQGHTHFCLTAQEFGVIAGYADIH